MSSYCLVHLYLFSFCYVWVIVDDDFATPNDTSEDLAQFQATLQQGKQPLPQFLI